MKFDEAMKTVLLKGTKVRGVKWPKGVYIHLDSFDQAVYDTGDPYQPGKDDILQSWEEYQELGVGSKLRKEDAAFVVIQESPAFVSIVNTDDWTIFRSDIEINKLGFVIDSLGLSVID